MLFNNPLHVSTSNVLVILSDLILEHIGLAISNRILNTDIQKQETTLTSYR
ncbi:MAG TPA: hypothetical protein VE643_08450 [Nitrososphaeraceae archaeon]|nr:hypothetical protein [Nitrososphaeraceae archaeon]